MLGKAGSELNQVFHGGNEGARLMKRSSSSSSSNPSKSSNGDLQGDLSGDESSRTLAHASHYDTRTDGRHELAGNVCTSHRIVGLATDNASSARPEHAFAPPHAESSLFSSSADTQADLETLPR